MGKLSLDLRLPGSACTPLYASHYALFFLCRLGVLILVHFCYHLRGNKAKGTGPVSRRGYQFRLLIGEDVSSPPSLTITLSFTSNLTSHDLRLSSQSQPPKMSQPLFFCSIMRSQTCNVAANQKSQPLFFCSVQKSQPLFFCSVQRSK